MNDKPKKKPVTSTRAKATKGKTLAKIVTKIGTGIVIDQMTDEEKAERIRRIGRHMHYTDKGYCIHDWVPRPCNIPFDCYNCTEFIASKVSPEKISAIIQRIRKRRRS